MSNEYFNHLDDKEIFAFGDLHGDIHALRLLLNLTESIDPPELGWDKLYEKVFAETDLHLNDLRRNISLYDIFGGFSDEIKQLFPKWKDGMENKVIVVTGDMIDNLRGKYTKLDDSVTCHIGFVKQEELKIVLCLKILDYQAIQADRGCGVITLLGNHEDMNIKLKKTNYFCKDDQFYYDGANFITRKDFFKLYCAIFNFKDGQKKIIFRVNNNIFMHGGLTSEILDIYKNLLDIDISTKIDINKFISHINEHYNIINNDYDYNIYYKDNNDILWNRYFGEPNEETTVNICNEFNKMINYFTLTADEKFNLIVGHCVQTFDNIEFTRYMNQFDNEFQEPFLIDSKLNEFVQFLLDLYNNVFNTIINVKLLTLEHLNKYYTDLKNKVKNISPDNKQNNKQYLRFFHSNINRTKNKHIISSTTEEKNILNSYDSIFKNSKIEFPLFIGINTTKCGTDDRIIRLDVGMSKAFDNEFFYTEFKKLYYPIKYIDTGTGTGTGTESDSASDFDFDSSEDISNLTLERIMNEENSHHIKKLFFLLVKYVLSRAPQLLHITITKETEVFRASLTNTLKYMCRNNNIIIPQDDHVLNTPFYAIIAYIDNCSTRDKTAIQMPYRNYLIA